MDDKLIIKLYSEGKSLAALSRMSGLSTYKVRQLLVNNNIEIRTQAQQNVFSNQERAKSVNEHYFDKIDNLKKAWILGFIAADGSISKKRNCIKIGLSTVDKEILEKIRQEVKIERCILDSETNNGFAISDLTWSNANHKYQLSKYGIVPNKTYHTINVPKLPLELQLAYIQGYFDGDGCFRDDGKYCRWEICGYKKETLESIANVLNKFVKKDKKVYMSPNRKNYYTLTYSTEDAFTILNKSYEICPLTLKRKRDKFFNWAKRNQRI